MNKKVEYEAQGLLFAGDWRKLTATIDDEQIHDGKKRSAKRILGIYRSAKLKGFEDFRLIKRTITEEVIE